MTKTDGNLSFCEGFNSSAQGKAYTTREMEFCDNSVGNHSNDLAMIGMRWERCNLIIRQDED